ncbi:2,3-bisphosphoglycerate-independent phosphoglycerate mutase [Sutterella sp.]|uniref:2,3-bisphosphoglycerate-independent phosphoglycerate mutase n=1 Tax=Sutterella sp. TaxID=1981025 RepID=UPI0026E06CF8|nr:2,3-bisphosphoglycerate-independent phosphoglycerate mutase [Sutterella sp.]MDO5532430.1 2,3-bisphosphoglycerate-independent phosphoglycerate mutase [Sutterella sp.]
MQKVLLMILDGWGIGGGAADPADAIHAAHPEYLSELMAKYPNAELLTFGENVGLPDGQMGNSEVGHLNIGAGRVVYQDLVRINRAARAGKLAEEPEIAAMLEHLKASGRPLHLMGLFSDGGVHASYEHLVAFIDLAKAHGVKQVYVHAFMDGRDTDPKSGLGFVKALEEKLAQPGETARLVSMIGRFYAMDRDKRWERVEEAWKLLVKGTGTPSTDFVKTLEASYAEGVTDEFVRPVVRVNESGEPVGRIEAGDTVVFLNFRNDRARELTTVLTQRAEGGMTPLPLWFATMTPYDATFEGLHVLFSKENVVNPIGEYISTKGLRQLRIAETEKYAHVTFFLNGGREEPFEGEDRILVPSPKVATYDLAPEMSAPEVSRKLCEALAEEKHDFICLNFANGDMVGHTGVWEAIEKAVKAVDGCVKDVIETARAHGYEVVQIADHGNADHAKNEDGSPNTAHSLNPVPILVVSDRVAKVSPGVLADVAPTVLTLMGLPVPQEMTGRNLVEFK